MPSGDEYAKKMKSKIADLKISAADAALALGRHFSASSSKGQMGTPDIAGMDMFEHGISFAAEGSTGFSVRLLTTFLVNLAKIKRCNE
jgi:leucyl aminopeptidase